MSLPHGPLLPLIALVWPLLLGLAAALPRLRANALLLLPLAPIPALWLALTGAIGVETQAPDLLLGVVLALDREGALFLGTIAFLWMAAGLYAVGYMRRPKRPGVFAGFWCLTLAGNLGVCLARDVASFYVAFAAVSLAAYFLVVNEGTKRALRAGRIYITLAVIGEVCLLTGLLIGVSGAQSLLVVDVRASLAGGPLAGLAVALLVVGFGLKAGLVPFHVWLPLAHPAAPVPASAVLSGAIVKAGVIGLIRFMPDGPDGATAGTALIAAGLFGAFAGVLVGLSQRDPKTVLAYSTISQMGLILAILGAGLAAGDTGSSNAVAALYAAHHGLAKGALFLAVGIVAATGRRHLPLAVAATALAALSVAGFPLSGGALAKAAAKPIFSDATRMMVALSATGTTLLLVHFLVLLAREPAADADARPHWLMVLSWSATLGGCLVVPWVAFLAFSGMGRGYVLAPSVLWDAAWPVLLGLLLAVVAAKIPLRIPTVPEGDLIVPVGRATNVLTAWLRRLPEPAAPAFGALRLAQESRLLEMIEQSATRWNVAGLLILTLGLAIAAAVLR